MNPIAQAQISTLSISRLYHCANASGTIMKTIFKISGGSLPKDKDGNPPKPKGKTPKRRKSIVVIVPVLILEVVSTPGYAFR